jgi:type II secretory pathway predicted ATPase ExeA
MGRVFLSGARLRAYIRVYKCAVDDPCEKPSLADGPNFLASLSELDRGLTADDAAVRPAARASEISAHRGSTAHAPTTRAVAHPPIAAAASQEPARFARRIPLPPPIVSPFDALSLAKPAAPEPVAGSTEAVRRPLKDLIPPEMVQEARHARKPESALATIEPPAADQTPTCEEFYGFDEKPFSLSTDPRFFFHSTPHDAVSQQLLTSIRKREGLVVLTGEMGSGKTTLCRTVIEQLDRRTLTSLVTDPFVSGEDLLKMILVDFGVASRQELARGDATCHELSTTLLSFIESLAPLQASAIVMIDEAQNLPADVLEQVRILAEAGEASTLLQVILVGQPSLTTLLRRPEYASLQQRVAVRSTLLPLPLDELDDYLIYRMAVAGTGPRVQFDQPAIERIYRLSKGLPRVVNLIADRALAHGAELCSGVIDASLIDAAAEDLDLGEPKSIGQRLASSAATIVALALFALLGAGLAALLFRDTFTRALALWRH